MKIYMQSYSKICKEMDAVFQFCSQYNKLSNPIVCGTARVRIICEHLNHIRVEIFDVIQKESLPNLDSTISRGNGNFPRVPWVAFHMLGKKVSNSLSVTMCFSKDGRGVVIGLMSATGLRTEIETIERTSQEHFLDVRGSQNTSYNNKFINPKEFFSESLDIKDIISHITNSLDLLYSYNK